MESVHNLPALAQSALCTNLAKACTKQFLTEEAALFTQLAAYFEEKAPETVGDFASLSNLGQADLTSGYPAARTAAGPDRGALRAIVWGEKVTRMASSLLTRYQTQGNALVEQANVYVCEICGFIYTGDQPPEICPVCKVPNLKLMKVERRAQ